MHGSRRGMQQRHMDRAGMAQSTLLRVGALAITGLVLGLLCWTTQRPRADASRREQTELRSSVTPAPVHARAAERPAHPIAKHPRTDALRDEVVAWTRREHPDAEQYADYLAGYVCLLDRMLANESPTLAEVAEMLSLYRRWIRAADANGDGSVRDDGPGMTAARRYLTSDQSPHVRSLLDANQDGAISDEEWLRVSPERLKVQLLGSVAEQEKFVKWDVDGDGTLSPDELTEGDSRLASFTIVQPDGKVRRRLRDEDVQSPAEQTAVLAEIAAKQGASAADHARDALEWLRLERLCSPHVAETGMESLLILADTVAALVGNKEEAVSVTDSGAGQPDVAAPRPRGLPSRGSARDATKRAQMLVEFLTVEKYHVHSAQYDADGNGRIDDAEWVARVADEDARRDAAIAQLYCDTDGDGAIDTRDMVRFLEWLDSHSPRADVNGDGRVDPQDLQQFIDYYGR